MKKYLLAGTLAGAFSLPMYAHAACDTLVIGTVQFYSNCHADNQANDGDDLKMFVDKTPRRTNVIDGSLGANNQLFQNVIATTNADFETDGSGFANFKSVDAGSVTNTLTGYIFAPNPLSNFLPGGGAFTGFDGQLFRGQVDNTGIKQGNTIISPFYNGELFVLVTFQNGTTVSHTYTGIGDKNDFGVLGFDELAGGVENLVRSVFISVNDPFERDALGLNPLCAVQCGPIGGAWNEFKQIEFSVPGAVAVVPEPQTWAMFIIGFGIMGFMGWKRSLKHPAATTNAVA